MREQRDRLIRLVRRTGYGMAGGRRPARFEHVDVQMPSDWEDDEPMEHLEFDVVLAVDHKRESCEARATEARCTR